VPTEDAADAEVAAAMGEVPAVGTPAGAGAVRVGEDARAEEGDDGEEEGEDDDLGLELLDLVDEIGSRGANAAPDDVSDVLEIATDLAAADPAGMNWDLSPHLAGAWRLRFTNSKAFHLNGGLTGYAKEVAGVTTPELIMKVGDGGGGGRKRGGGLRQGAGSQVEGEKSGWKGGALQATGGGGVRIWGNATRDGMGWAWG
jgi:hypothetical protein